ncbi:MAG: glycosyltransferase family 4 protein [Flavobacteriales bacterium]|nr:glycosyltransferase family 4 protein [Flavobacteriales bacterium]
MKIALFTDGITPYVVGGIQRHSYYLCKYLAKNGIKVDLYHTTYDGTEVKELDVFSKEELLNIRSFFIPFPRHKKIFGHYIRESYDYSCKIYDLFLRNCEGVSFVYAKNYTGWKYIEEKNKGKDLPRIGVNLHGYELFQYYKGLRDNLFVIQHRKPTYFLTKNADIVFSYGRGISRLLNKNISDIKGEIVEIPTGISEEWLRDVNSLNIHKGMLNFVFLGRNTKRKGIHFIHKYLKERNDKLNLRIYFIGPIPENTQVKGDNIHYLGQIKDVEKIKSILDECDVLLCPSFSEGMPNVIVEGMARGCAVLGSKVGAVEDMVNDSNGWMIEPGDYKDFRDNMDKILNESVEIIFEKRCNSIKIVQEKFLWSEVIKLVQKKIE